MIVHRQRLDHERGLKRDEANLAALDDAIEATSAAIRDAPDVVRAAMLGEPDAADQQIEWLNTVSTALAMQAPLHLRLGEEHPACKALDRIMTTLVSLGGDLNALRQQEGDQSAQINKRGLQAAQEAAKGYADFVQEAWKILTR